MQRSSIRIATLTALLALPALGSVVIAQTLEQMAQRVPLVVRGTVGQVQSQWDEGHRTIETWAELVVTESLKGGAKIGTVVFIRNPGGTVGEVRAHVSGAPSFTQGEDTLLFLEPSADTPGVWLVNALAAGKVTFTKNAFGEPRATRDLRGIAFYQGPGPAKYREVTHLEDLGTPDQLMARIRAALPRPTPSLPQAPSPTGVTR